MEGHVCPLFNKHIKFVPYKLSSFAGYAIRLNSRAFVSSLDSNSPF